MLIKKPRSFQVLIKVLRNIYPSAWMFWVQQSAKFDPNCFQTVLENLLLELLQ